MSCEYCSQGHKNREHGHGDNAVVLLRVPGDWGYRMTGVYLSGPVTGICRDLAIESFGAAERVCKRMWPGCHVFNPVQQIEPDASHEDAMLRCLHELTSGNYDALVRLMDGTKSAGAKLEAEVADSVGIKILRLSEVCDMAFERERAC